MGSHTGHEQGQSIPRKKRARDDGGAQQLVHYGRATSHASSARAVQRSRIVAEQLYEWCAQRDDSGHTQLISDTIRSEAYVLCLTDSGSSAALIVLCSTGFSRVTGFAPNEAIGRPISMLHGSKTSQDSALHMESAMIHGAATTVQMTSYTRSGQPFWNMMHTVPVPLRTADGGRLAFVLLNNVSEHLLCGRVGQFPIGLDFLSKNSSDYQIPQQLLGASLACRAEHAALAVVFGDCETARQLSFCIANLALDYCPISYASDRYLELNGCDSLSVLGHSCCLAGGLPMDAGRQEALVHLWKERKLPLTTSMVCFRKDHNKPVLHDAQLVPLLTQEGVLARIVVFTNLPPAKDLHAASTLKSIHHVLKRLTDAEAVDGSCAQFFLRLHARCQKFATEQL